MYYDEGVGSTSRDAISGGAFGSGLYDVVVEAYKMLVFNHAPGDQIFIFGFSRGAYTARSFAGLIHRVGIVNSCFADKIHVAAALYKNRDPRRIVSDSDVVNSFRSEFVTDTFASEQDREWRTKNVPGVAADAMPLVDIRYVGVWDTVKTLGSSIFSDRDGDGQNDYAFHDDELHESVRSARHAVALDEHREKFDVTLWSNIDDLDRRAKAKVDDPNRPYQQVWFPGGHGSVGGGGDIRGLSDEALEWILEGAKQAGLALEIAPVSKIWGIQPDVLAPLENSSAISWNPKDVFMRFLPPWMDRKGPDHIYEVSKAAIIRWAAPDQFTPERSLYRPKSLKKLEAEMNEAAKAYAAWEFETRGVYSKAGQTLPATISSGLRVFRRHTIAPGESLERISQNYFGTRDRVDDILAINRTTILDPGRYYAGHSINIP